MCDVFILVYGKKSDSPYALEQTRGTPPDDRFHVTKKYYWIASIEYQIIWHMHRKAPKVRKTLLEFSARLFLAVFVHPSTIAWKDNCIETLSWYSLTNTLLQLFRST